MAERKPCVRCERPIDAYARSCVYCGWDQTVERPVASAAPKPAAPAYVPPRDHRLRNRIVGAIAFIALVIIAFAVGSFVRSSDPNEAKAAQTPAATPPQTASASRTSQPQSPVTLVPVAGDGSMQQFEPPVTSAPLQAPSAGNVDVNGERTDATALPSGAYSAAADRARAERQVRGAGGPIDPRSITNNNTPVAAPATKPVRRTLPQSAPAQSQQPIRVAAPPHTEPIPIYQPVPPMRVERDSTARMYLTVGPDGRVHDIDVVESIAGEMPRLIAAVQNWRFRPALQNGQPVTSTFSVDIRVRAR
jgi:hypothetical protein